MTETHPFQPHEYEDALRASFENLLLGARLAPMNDLSYRIIATQLKAVADMLLDVHQFEREVRGR